MNELLACLQLEDLRDSDKELAEVVGIEAFKRLVEVYGGTSKLYVPMVDMVVIPVRDELIRRDFDGYNFYELAKKWEMSERYIRDIVKDKAKIIRQQPIGGQISFGDI